jgi:hypothetical protein
MHVCSAWPGNCTLTCVVSCYERVNCPVSGKAHSCELMKHGGIGLEARGHLKQAATWL